MLNKMFTVVGILALSAGLANAQNKKATPERVLGGTVESLQKELDLTGDQVTQLEAIFADLQTKLEGADRSEMRDLATSSQESVSQILDEEQKTKYKQNVQKGKKKGGRNGKGFLNIDSMTESLALTEGQVSTIGPILQDARQDIGETNKEMKKEGAERKEIFQEIKLIMDEYVKVIKDELTEDQGVKLDEMIASRKPPQKKDRRNRKNQKNDKNGDTPTGRPNEQGRKRPNIKATVAKLGLDEEASSELTRNLETLQSMRREVGAWNRDVVKDLAQLLDTGASDEQVQAKMTEIDETRKEKNAEIRELHEKTYGSLTVSQKARLMVDGIR